MYVNFKFASETAKRFTLIHVSYENFRGINNINILNNITIILTLFTYAETFNFSMNSSTNISLLDRLQSALNQQSLVLRCQEISHLLPEISTKDGSFILSTIVESIFGPFDENNSSIQHCGRGWGLRIITQLEHPSEFHALKNFLSPNGPLLNFIYRLLNEPVQLLPFSLTWLPAKIRNEIQDGTAGPFYTNKLQYLAPGKTANSLLFNSFEYYVFHFGVYLVGNGNQQWTNYWTSIKESLYPTLLEDYLTSFLPCDSDILPGPSITPVSPCGILSPISQKFQRCH
ncbi:Sphingomyelin phosphodiesterase 4 [Armadillidium vulgare]|nr:Sphingomyelin phosphodiesterase 4 [Armadillidium vulgare]